MLKSQRLIKSFADSLKPPSSTSVSDWANGRVAIYEGKSPFYDVTQTPWMREPLDELKNSDTNEIVILAPIGSGKTTMLEAALAYFIAEDPGPTLFVGQTDEMVNEWFETRLDFSLQNTKETSVFLPTGKDRHKKKKGSIIFNHMTLFSTGAKISGLQTRSMRRVIMDEAWTYKKGMIKEGEGRLHDRWNRQFLLVSQGGNKGDDWHKRWENVNQYEFMWECPCCKTKQPYSWSSVKYDETLEDKVKIAKSAYIECINGECDYIIKDDSQQRRQIAQKAKYIKTKDGLPNTKGFHFTQICNWHVPLWRLVLERFNAMEEVKRGNLDLLRQFLNKRLAEFWDDSKEDERVTLNGAGYTVRDYEGGQKWEHEHVRFLTVDRQQDHFWACIRAWSADGRSRLLFYGKIDTWDEIELLRMKYKVDARKTQVDCGFQTDEVYKRCAKYGWLALRGDRRNQYPHKTPNQPTIYKPFSAYQPVQASDGKKTAVAFYSNLAMKDTLFMLRNQKGMDWQIPDGISDDYLRQLDSETRRGEGASAIWTKRKNDNHAFDTETQQVTLASMMKLIGTPDNIEYPEESPEEEVE